MAYIGEINTGPVQDQVSLGMVTGWSSLNKFGASDVISTSYVDIWPNASTLSYLSSAERMNIVSTSGNDDLGSSGAITMTIFGLDGNYDEINETVTLDGTTNVLTTNSYLRVSRLIVRTAGTTGSNEGVITATAETAATVQAYIIIGSNQTLQTQYTMPNNKYLNISNIEFTIQKGDQAQVRLLARPLGEVFQVKRSYNFYQLSTDFILTAPLTFAPKTDITIRAIKITGAGNVAMSASYDGFLVDSSLVE